MSGDYYVNNLYEQMKTQPLGQGALLDTPCVIFDLDGCISDDQWRFKFILEHASNPDDKYRVYNSKLGDDKPIDAGFQHLAYHIRKGRTIIFCTARPLEFKEKTIDWITTNVNNIPPFILLMRANGCEEPSLVIKKRMLMFLAEKHKVNVQCAYDDRTDVCREYLAFGLETYIANRYGLTQFTSNGTQPPGPEPEGVRPKDAADLLEEVITTMRERNATYKDSYKGAARILKAMFPAGITVTSEAEFERLHLIQQLASKLARAANSGFTHRDSVIDISGYSAMLAKFIDDEKGIK